MIVFNVATKGGLGADYSLRYSFADVGTNNHFDVGLIVRILVKHITSENTCYMVFGTVGTSLSEFSQLCSLAKFIEKGLAKVDAMWRLRNMEYKKGSYKVAKREGLWTIGNQKSGSVYLYFTRFGVEDI